MGSPPQKFPQRHRSSGPGNSSLGTHGPVHSANRRGAYLAPCACGTTHGQRDDILGTPLDPDSYDYEGAVFWRRQDHAPIDWRIIPCGKFDQVLEDDRRGAEPV